MACYVCAYDDRMIVNLQGQSTEVARDTLIAKVKQILDLIEREGLVRGKKTAKVNRFYIGKSYIRERKNQDFVLGDYETWSVAGIQKRWRQHQQEEYGESGMMVIAAIGQESIPRGVQDVTKEQYALALEQMLIHHYKLFKKDDRIANDTFTSGRTDGNSSTAYALYMAYSIL